MDKSGVIVVTIFGTGDRTLLHRVGWYDCMSVCLDSLGKAIAQTAQLIMPKFNRMINGVWEMGLLIF